MRSPNSAGNQIIRFNFAERRIESRGIYLGWETGRDRERIIVRRATYPVSPGYRSFPKNVWQWEKFNNESAVWITAAKECGGNFGPQFEYFGSDLREQSIKSIVSKIAIQFFQSKESDYYFWKITHQDSHLTRASSNSESTMKDHQKT